MATFKIEVVRISYGFKTIEVQADNLEDAQNKALDDAGNYEFTESSAEYELDGV
jgi:hypothetical protein